MKINQIIGIGLLASVGISVLGSMFVDVNAISQNLYTLAGLGFFVFGTWGGIRFLTYP